MSTPPNTTGSTGERTEQPQAPTPGRHLRVVRGDPTPEEVAALVAVLTARAHAARAARDRAEAAAHRAPASGWRERSRVARRPPRPGPGAWRASLR